MSTPTASHIRSLYRSLLRELPPRPILAAPRSPLHQRIRSSFHSGSAVEPHRELKIMEQFLQYLRSQRLYVALVERYNPGMDMSEEERVRLTARRVGMELPVLHPKGS